jgi:fibro-slime domain-containing protein
MKMEAKGYSRTAAGCYVVSNTYKADYVVSKVDGNPLFFPVDGDPFTPASELKAATLSASRYDASYSFPYDVDATGQKRLHNFSFTDEIHAWFRFDKSQSYSLEFVGDDDLWVFINGKLAVDLGGIHMPVLGSLVIASNGNGTATVTATYYPGLTEPRAVKTTSALGLVDGKLYEIAVFHAERQSNATAYEVSLPASGIAPSVCTR